MSEGWCSIKTVAQRGQITVELAIQIPILLLLLFGVVQFGRVFYTYHSLQKALRGGAGVLSRAANVNYCDIDDATIRDAKNLIVYGNLQGIGTPVVVGLTPDMIQILPERQPSGDTTVTSCFCVQNDPDSCDAAVGGRVPEFVVVRLEEGFPVIMAFPMVTAAPINLQVSVRMPVTGS